MAAGTTEDPCGTVAATTGGEDTVDESTATEAMEAGGTATGTQTTPETVRTAQVQRITTPQRPTYPVSIDASSYRGINGTGDDG